MMSFATTQIKPKETYSTEHFPLNFNSLLNKLKTIEDKDAIEESLDKLKTMPTKDNAPTIIKMYEDLIDISKVKELNLEREAFYNTYRRKLSEFKFNAIAQGQDKTMQNFLFRSMGSYSTRETNAQDADINADVIKKRSMNECKNIRTFAKKQGKEEARILTATISNFRSPTTLRMGEGESKSYYSTPRKLLPQVQLSPLRKTQSKYEPSGSDNFNNLPMFSLNTLPSNSCSPPLTKRRLIDRAAIKPSFKTNTKSWFAKILQSDI